jgi:hypothetical protein
MYNHRRPYTMPENQRAGQQESPTRSTLTNDKPFTARLTRLAIAAAITSAIAAAPAIGQSIGALSQSQTLTDAQAVDVRDWMSEQLDTLITGTPEQASEAAQTLVEPFWRSEVTAAFRFACQDALAPMLEGELDDTAGPLPRATALRLCARVATSGVLPALQTALQSDEPTERAFAIAAYDDFFATADEEASPIRQSTLDEHIRTLTGTLANEEQPALATALIGTLGRAGEPRSTLRLATTRAMADGLVRRLTAGVNTENTRDWTVALIRALQTARETYVEQQLRPQGIDDAFEAGVGRLCAATLAFSADAADTILAGDAPDSRNLILEMVDSANSLFVLVDEANADGIDDLRDTLEDALNRANLDAYLDRLRGIIGPNGAAADAPFNFDPVDL